MPTYVLIDVNGKKSYLQKPIKVNIISSDDAPADSLYAVFAVSGPVPVLDTAYIFDGKEKIFSGKVDSQTQEKTVNGNLLTVRARSMECILLDNEAEPQTYCMPSMPLLMKRHFEPLGFYKYIGSDKAFNGEFDVVKGMSEWSVLCRFCKYFLNTVPHIDRSGVIDITGAENNETVFLTSDRCKYVKKTWDRSSLISDIYARTYTAGGYEMPLENDKAKKLGVMRKRYVNCIDSDTRTVLTARDMIRKSNSKYERIEAECTGCVFCTKGAKLIMDGEDKNFRISEVHYALDENGESTTLYAEARY